MPPDPPRSSALRASLLPLRGISHSILTKNLGIYAEMDRLLVKAKGIQHMRVFESYSKMCVFVKCKSYEKQKIFLRLFFSTHNYFNSKIYF